MKPNFNLVDRIIEYESGEIPVDKFIELFQYLVDTGIVWQLQGHYGRTAQELIRCGYIEHVVELCAN